MADILTFESNEFEIIETFEFDEEIQRPEETRFFTLDEQLLDYMDKMMPKRKPTKSEIKDIKYTRDRIRVAYNKLITITDTDYIIDTTRKSLKLSWVHPVYSPFEYRSYSYDKNLKPFSDSTRRRAPNYYPQLLGALPDPYISKGSGRILNYKTEAVNEEGENPIGVLGDFISSKTLVNDDGTYDIVSVVNSGTSDGIKSIGYFLDDRPEIPRPMMEHPFLKSGKSSFYQTDNVLLDVFPSIQAILEHAIPVTTDPYNEKALKLYDIRLSQIPWSSWKERFPPAELKEIAKEPKSIEFKSEKEDQPGDTLIKRYSVPWYPGLRSRLWLSMQVDAGHLVSKILLSESSEFGLLPVIPSVGMKLSDLPEADPEVCLNLTSNFDMFMHSGLFRPVYTKEKEKVLDKLKCVVVPIGTILQEKSDVATNGRLVWKETTKHDIVSEYQEILKKFQVIKEDFIPKYEKAKHIDRSEREKDILIIIEDPNREPEDKADVIENLVRNLILDDHIYYDVAGLFVVCSHTIAYLRGALQNRLEFYSEWTVTQDGKRICKHCGEMINSDVFIATKEYDEDGHVSADYEALEQRVVIGNDVFVNSLLDLKKVFNLENAGENIMFICLSILQILPNEQQLLPIIQRIRALTAGLKARSASSKAITKEKQDLIEGILGLAGITFLLQTHTPFLIPKRSIGNRPLNLSGYPRDSDDPETCNTLNSLIILLKKTFEQFPASYKGNISTILREILKNSKELRTQSLVWIKHFSEQFKLLLENARERYEIPLPEAPRNSLQLPIQRVDDSEFIPGDTMEEEFVTQCSVPRLSISLFSKRLPSYRQKELNLSSKIYPSPLLQIIDPIQYRTTFSNLSDNDVRKRLALGLPTGFSGLSEFMKIADGPAYTTLISQILTILSQTTFSTKLQKELRKQIINIDIQNKSLYRDIAKGFLFELLHAVKASPPALRALNDALKNDLTLKMIMLSEAASKKEDFTLRSKERNKLKFTLRSMNDTEREVTRQLVQLGIADFIVTNADREQFSREFQRTEIEFTPEEEDGTVRDYVENGDEPIADDGNILNVDHGEYGDRGVRDYDDYTTQPVFVDDD